VEWKSDWSAAENDANVWTRIVSATSLESSVDGGITWQAVPPTTGTTFVGLASIAFGDGKWVMAGENKQYYSLDGQQWTEASVIVEYALSFRTLARQNEKTTAAAAAAAAAAAGVGSGGSVDGSSFNNDDGGGGGVGSGVGNGVGEMWHIDGGAAVAKAAKAAAATAVAAAASGGDGGIDVTTVSCTRNNITHFNSNTHPSHI
jgi:hypothetical protein